MAKRFRADVLVCGCPDCVEAGAQETLFSLKEEVRHRGLEDEVRVIETGSRGFCATGPIVIIEPEGILYIRVKAPDVPELVEEMLVKGRVVERLTYTEPATRKRIPYYREMPFYSEQTRIVLRNCGLINPRSVEEYIAVGGYRALERVLFTMSPQEVIEQIKASGLRGRGGAGFPAGRKWESARRAEGEIKYVIANGDEGDPNCFMDRSLMEGDPHGILEGMIIGAYAIGAREGFIYLPYEYTLAVENLSTAVRQVREYGLLGENILGSGFDFDVQIRLGARSFVGGESTALMHAIEGMVSEPRPKHIHTTTKGVWDRPSNLNNVKTWAMVPQIISNGAEWFASIGTEDSKGTQVFSLAGKVNNTGLAEVPMGITMRKLVFDIGGGSPKNREFKAIQIGGPSGGVLPASMLDLPLDYESLAEAGSMMGTGGVVVMDDRTCMVDLARYFINFLQEESCGKCVPCREGNKRALQILTRITRGEGTEEDLETLENLARVMQQVSLCGLGKTAPNPILSTLHYFRNEYLAHIRDQYCPAGVCRELITYFIVAEKCLGCGLCIKICPQSAITGAKKEPHVIDQTQCIQCGACFDTCRFDAIAVKSREEAPKEVVA